MYSVVSGDDLGSYQSGVVQLIRESTRHGLLVGAPPAGLTEALRNHPATRRVEFAMSDKPAGIPRRDWDLVVLCPGVRWADVCERLEAQARVPDVLARGERAPTTVLVCIQKSGSHLVHRGVEPLGYEIVGDGARKSYAKIHKALQNEGITRYDSSIPFDFFVRNFGAPGVALSTHGLRVEPDTNARQLGGVISPDAFPEGALWNWIKTGEPPIVFGYRDPRDVIVSMIYYLMGDPSASHWQMLTAQILAALPTMHARIDYIIRCVPSYLDVAFRQHVWLLYHPRVCKLSFEELIGERGGGSEMAQEFALLRLLDQVRVSGDPKLLARQLFSDSVRTFRKGQIGAWREEFSSANRDEFMRRYGDLVELYGYSA